MSARDVSGDQIATGPERRLLLDGTFNVRDLGGHVTTDGRRIRARALLRADSLHGLPPHAQATLLALGLRTVIDLRRRDEAAAAPNVFATSSTIQYHMLSLPSDMLFNQTGSTQPSLATLYQSMLERGRAQVRQIIAILSGPNALPALVHCTAGKDRTGVIAALLLGLAGAPAETIVADYALTSQYLTGTAFETARRRAAERGYAWANSPELLACPPGAMEDTLRYLRDRHGGVVGYVRSLGFRDQHIERLREALLEPVDQRGQSAAR